MPEKITITLTAKEAEMITWLRKYKSVWYMAKKLKPGSLVLHFKKEKEDTYPKLAKKEFHFYES